MTMDKINPSATPSLQVMPRDLSSAYSQRLLGDSELSYFLPSRKDGVNDMYLHLGFRAPSSVVNPHRLALAWAILRIRHPLLASSVVSPPGNYEDVFFQYNPPRSPAHALEDAFLASEICEKTKEALIDSYLNGPRTLSNDRLSYLVLSYRHAVTASSQTFLPPGEVSQVTGACHEFDLLICATHFIGDGMALHMSANDLFSLLAGRGGTSGKIFTDSDLNSLLEEEWARRWDQPTQLSKAVHVLPPALETRLPKPRSTFQKIAQSLEFEASQERLLGSHTFPRQKSYLNSKRYTIVPTTSFSISETNKILTRCKEEGVSISHLLFSICNNAWIKVGKPERRLPMMMYSALDLRRYLPLLPSTCSSSLSGSYWFLAVGYFNVILPSFPTPFVFPRARLAKQQCIAAAGNRLLLSRTRFMAYLRSANAKSFAAMDDEPEKRIGEGSSAVTLLTPSPPPALLGGLPLRTTGARPCSKALLGLSLLGNLDRLYQHVDYPSVTLHTLTTGSRQRPGGLLVFGYTFAGKLWLSLGYDKEAYDDIVGLWWNAVVTETRDLLVPVLDEGMKML